MMEEQKVSFSMAEDVKKTFGANLRRLRKRSGWTQERLAEAVGVAVQTVRAWEAGRVFPSSENIDTICECFKTDATALFGAPVVTNEEDALEAIQQSIGFLKSQISQNSQAAAKLSSISDVLDSYAASGGVSDDAVKITGTIRAILTGTAHSLNGE